MKDAARIGLVLALVGGTACAASGHESDEGAESAPEAGVSSGAAGSSDLASAFTESCPSPALGPPVLRLLTRAEFDQTIADIFPTLQGQWTDTLPADPLSTLGFENDSSNAVANQLAGGILQTALSVATALTGSQFASILPCAATSPDRTCATQLLTQYGRRLFRRPLTQAEQARYLAFYDSSVAKSNFQYAIKWMTVGLIQSPNAIYRSEIGVDNGDGTRSLTPYELATELAYTYTGSTPSAELLTGADNGSIGDPVAQATTLLQTDGGTKALEHFFEDYLEYPNVATIQKPNIPAFSTVSADMVTETQQFIDAIVFQQGGGLQDLLTSPTTNVSAALATYYGFPAPSSAFASVPRPAGEGIGLLAQGSFLALYADSTSSSPTLRGLFPYSHLLCHDTPSPPNTVPSLDAIVDAGLITTRERFEDEHAQGYCIGCHGQWDPMGFGFEHYDEGGRYRKTDNTLPVDSSGWVPDPNKPVTLADGGPGGYAPVFSFQDEDSFMNGLVKLPVIYACFAGYLGTYAFGTSEPCLGASKIADLQSGTIGIAQAFAALAAEPHFSKRTSQ